MPSLTAPLIAAMLAFAALAGQTAIQDTQETRLQLEAARRELLATLQDRSWMHDQSRATVARLQIEHHWKACAENEAVALAKGSERPASLLAESALAACRLWQSTLELALERGAYPYVEGANAAGRVSREDMVAEARLASKDAALGRILLWRGVARVPGRRGAQITPRAEPSSGASWPAPVPQRLAPPEPPAPAEPPLAEGEEPPIVVTAQLRSGCRVQLADRPLTEKELGAKAREWLANGTALKVVRPRGADYRCMAKIAWQLGRNGLHLFEFVEASEVLEPTGSKRK